MVWTISDKFLKHFKTGGTEYYRKSVLYLLKRTWNMRLSRCSSSIINFGFAFLGGKHLYSFFSFAHWVTHGLKVFQDCLKTDLPRKCFEIKGNCLRFWITLTVIRCNIVFPYQRILILLYYRLSVRLMCVYICC